jgi:hypothetical protein
MADQETEVNEIEQEAASMGWVPQEKFKGDPDKWIPADEFVEKGRHVVPIMRANNDRMRRELLTRDTQIGTLQSQLDDLRKQFDTLDSHYAEASKRAITEAKNKLIADLKSAREEGDTDKEQALLDQLDEVRDTERQNKAAQAKKFEEKKDPPGAYTEQLDPDTRAFMEENPWFDSDKKRTKAYLRVVEDMRDEGVTSKGKAFLDEALERLEEQESGEPHEPQRPNSKVETGNARGGNRSSSKSFASLPADAKAACRADAEILVGPNKKFKEMKDWEAEYARIYYSQS